MKYARLYFLLPLVEGALILVGASIAGGALGLFADARLRAVIPGLVVFLALLAGFGWLSWLAWRRPESLERWLAQATPKLTRPAVYWTLVIVLSILSLLGLYLLPLFAQVFAQVSVFRIYHLIFPFLLWAVLLIMQTLVALRLLRHGTSFSGFAAYHRMFVVWGIAGLFLLALALIVKYAVTPDFVGWGAPGVIMLGSQVLLALALAIGLLALILLAIKGLRRLFPPGERIQPGLLIDIAVVLLLWAASVWQWSSQPLRPTWFNPRPVEPNMEYYPYSDSVAYDVSAQRLLMGAGFEPEVIRPVYSGFLALAQAVSGIDYHSVANWQVVVLALIPALLYLLARMLHHRLSGLLLGVLMIIQQTNSLRLAGIIDVSNAKMVMSDMPAQLGAILFCLLLVAWLQAPASRKLYPLLAGGVLAIFILVRTQFAIFIPVLPFLAWLTYRGQPRRWLRPSLLFLAALLIALSPWIVRSFAATQSLLSDPEPQGLLFRYSTFASAEGQGNPEELAGPDNPPAGEAVVQGLLSQPLGLVKVMAAHYLNNHASTLFTLPTVFHIPELFADTIRYPWQPYFWIRFGERSGSLLDNVERTQYWATPRPHTLPPLWLPLISGLALIGLGFAAARQKSRVAVWTPVLLALLYNVGNAVARLSGWRFNLPVDWVGLLFYAIGLVQLLFLAGVLFSNRAFPRRIRVLPDPEQDAAAAQRPYPKGQALALCLAFFLFVAIFPLAERLIPYRFAGMTAESTLAELKAEGVFEQAGVDWELIQSRLQAEGAGLYLGRAFYPRHYDFTEGSESVKTPAFRWRPYSRLGLLLEPHDKDVVLPLRYPPQDFPNAGDVLVLGCNYDDYLRADLVVTLGEPRQVLASSRLNDWDCTTP